MLRWMVWYAIGRSITMPNLLRLINFATMRQATQCYADWAAPPYPRLGSRGDVTSCSQWNNCLVCPAVRLSGLDRVQQSQSFLRLPLPSLGFYYIIIFLLLLIDLALSRDFSLFFFSFFVLWFGAREINWKMHLMIFQICFQPHAQLYASGPRQMQISWGVKGRMRHAPHSNCNCNNCRNGMLYIYIVP